MFGVRGHQQVNACLNNVVIGLVSLAGVTNLAAKRGELAYDPTEAKTWLFQTQALLSNK